MHVRGGLDRHLRYLKVAGFLRLECDSKQYHLTEQAYRNDRRRDLEGLLVGETTLRLTYDDIIFGGDAIIDAIIVIVANLGGRLPARQRRRLPELRARLLTKGAW